MIESTYMSIVKRQDSQNINVNSSYSCVCKHVKYMFHVQDLDSKLKPITGQCPIASRHSDPRNTKYKCPYT